MNFMASFLVTCEVLIGNYKFSQVHSITTKSSWKEISDTAIIQLPLLRGKVSKDNINETLANKINEGDKVSIKMGYIGLLKSWNFDEFSGFVRRVKPNYPLTIECEDYVYLLRRTNLQKTWKNTTLKAVINFIVDSTNEGNQTKIKLSGNIPHIDFEKFRVSNVNGAQALQRIKDEYGIVSYFRGDTLYVGLAYSEKLGKVYYNFSGDNGNVVKSDLTYRTEKENNIKIKAISILKDNKQKKVEIPKNLSDCEVKTVFFYNITSDAQLNDLAEQELLKHRYTGYEGSIQTLLLPQVQHSMIAVLKDYEFDSRNGEYFIDSVETTFGRGIKRKVEIGKVI
jgi:hypothetical protein